MLRLFGLPLPLPLQRACHPCRTRPAAGAPLPPGPAMTGERASLNPEIHVELLWFADCPNHEEARRLLHEVLDERGIPVTVEDIDATDPAVAEQVHFPGSPTIRVNGQDVAPGFVDPGDYAPRCRIYWTKAGPRGLPARAWIEAALEAAAVRD